jgi:hypothetical protein
MDITNPSQTWIALSQSHHTESPSRSGQIFDEAVILLQQVVVVFDLPELYTVGKESSSFETSYRLVKVRRCASLCCSPFSGPRAYL